jgi:hypothetical protein
MDKEKTIFTLDEFNRKVDRKEITSKTHSSMDDSYRIECPNIINDRGNICKAHLVDLPFHTAKGRLVGCQFCYWKGYRKVFSE